MQLSDYHKQQYVPTCMPVVHEGFILMTNISEIWALVMGVKVKGFEVRSSWIILINIDWKR